MTPFNRIGGTVNVVERRSLTLIKRMPLGAALTQNRGRFVHAAGSFAIDRYQGEERVQFRLIDIAPAEPFAGR